MSDEVLARIAEYERRYMNIKCLIVDSNNTITYLPRADSGRGEVSLFGDPVEVNIDDVLEDIDNNNTTYLLYPDRNSNPIAVLIPCSRYGELLSIETELGNPDGSIRIRADD